MATALKPKRGLESTRANQTPQSGELTYVVDAKKIYFGDGATAGGLEANYMDKTTDESVGGNKTFTSDVVIQGNITVQGTATSVDSTTVNIGDNIIVLNKDESGTPTADGGIEIERGTSINAQMVWVEANDRFECGEAGSLDYIVLGTQFGTHTSDASKHRVINDSGTLTTDLFSASKIIALASTKSETTHDHSGTYEPADAAIQTHLSATAKHREINDSGSAVTDLWSASKIASAITDGVATVNTLNEMTDVTISAPAAGHVVVRNVANDGWENKTLTNANIASASDLSTHTGDGTKHRIINDSGTTTIELFSASKIISELGTKSSTGHNHSGTYEAANSNIQTHISDATKHYLINDSSNTTTNLWSGSKINTELSGKSSTSHNHDVANLDGVNMTGVSDADVLQYDVGSGNLLPKTLSEAGIASSGHNHSGTYEAANANIQTTVTKVAGMDDNANNYSHPTNHAASVITQDTSNRFVTDAEKTTWNAKVATGDSRLSDSRTCNNTFDNASTARTNLGVDASGTVNYTHPNHSGDVTSTGDGVTVIGNNKVTLAKMADITTASIIGRNTADSGDPEVLSASTVRSILNVADGATANQTGAQIKTAYEAESDTNAFTDTLKSKLDGVDASANNYSHPVNHAATVITEDSTHRFATDAEKTTWNAKADGSHNHNSTYVSLTGAQTVGGNKTFSNNITITGDLTINGVTTSVNTATVNVGDNIMLLNSGEEGVPSANGGIEIERGTSTNTQMIWNESTDKWVCGLVGSEVAIVLEGDSRLTDSRTCDNTFDNATTARSNLNVEDGATADQTGAEIKSAYEAESDTNAYTDAEKTKLSGVDVSANNYSHPGTHSADIIVDGTTNKAYTATEKTKLSGVAIGANNYSHPSSHGPSIITQDSSNRFVTDAEKTTWNAKVATGDSRLSDSRTCNNTFDNASTARTNLGVDASGTVNYTHPNHSGDVTSTGDGVTVIGNNKVTLAMMNTVTTDSFLGRDTAGTGNVEVLSATSVRAILNVADGANAYTHPGTHSADIITDGTTNKAYTATEKTKLTGIATSANNYSHPANHAPAIITQDSSNRFVTDAEKTTWNAKVATDDSRLTDSRTCNNTFDSASTARTNLSVYSASEVDTLASETQSTGLMFAIAFG